MTSLHSSNLGLSGRIAQSFLTTEITPLLAMLGFLLGLMAILLTPREEEPQINVTFANVFIAFPGASASEVEQIISTPAEQNFSEIEGVKHVYSISQPGLSILTVQFEVGENRTAAILRLYDTVFSKQDWLPSNLGVAQPLVKPKGIDDVPIVTLTLWSEDDSNGTAHLEEVAHTIEAELKRVQGTRNIYSIGRETNKIVRILLDPVRLASYGLSIDDLRYALLTTNSSREAGVLVKANTQIIVQAGQFLSNVNDIGELVVGIHEDNLIYLREVAKIEFEPTPPEKYVWLGTGPAANTKGITTSGEFPAVTVAVAKQPGSNAVEIAEQVIARFEQMRGVFIPDNIQVTVTRNYGETAGAKAQKLIGKLIFATAFVVILVLMALGWREAIIVGLAVIITLIITLFASWAWGFTLNRVSLFALIFSIGILVDDAIVVVENVHRHIQLGNRNLLEAIPLAVDEVGGPTILATFTVIAALLPMAFVTGLMGPYMSPIPINASFGMLISLAVAFIFTPWLTYKVLRRVVEKPSTHAHLATPLHTTFTYRLFDIFLRPFLRFTLLRWLFLLVILGLIGWSISLVTTQKVVLKMLPFDNKSEFQIMVDLPEGTSVEKTAQVLSELGRYVATVPEVTDYQVYAGTASPIGFNGLVRQYYLRQSANLGDIQVNLIDSHHRHRKSHDIAGAMRVPLQAIGSRLGANVKVVEVPPGPPVQSPLVVEVYGLDYPMQLSIAKQIRSVFEQTPDIVDVDDSVEYPAPKLIVRIDQAKAARLGINQEAVSKIISTALGGEKVTYLRDAQVKYPIPLRLELATADKVDIDNVMSLQARNQTGTLISLSEFTTVVSATKDYAIYHKDLLPVVYVTGDMAGHLDSPLYGMFNIYEALQNLVVGGGYTLEQYLINPPANPYQYSIKWDGEWQVTYETFRDMGIAYAVGMILIYLLVVAQFRSYLVPVIIMAPIPLTVIGVIPGHALLHAQFTATSMIGMIALAGIIVRNSILLVDFIDGQVREGIPFEEAIICTGAARTKPIVLTGLAAMLGALFIIDDPIFSGLAIGLIFGISVATLLTLAVIPMMYYSLMRQRF